MTLVVTSLASGSSGNALLLRTDDATLLVDCGISLRAIERHLRYIGSDPAELHALLLTHEHGDHALSAGALARRYRMPVVCNAATRAALDDQLKSVTVEELPVGQRATIGPFDITSFLLPHDAAAPVGYRITTNQATVGIAVDLGSWTEDIVTNLCDTDLLVVEANHDRERLKLAPYPWPIRQRILSTLGHLDNVQTGELLARVGADGRQRAVWLAHLSEQANSPKLALAGVNRVLRMANVTALRLSALPRTSVVGAVQMPVWSSDYLLQQKEMFG